MTTNNKGDSRLYSFEELLETKGYIVYRNVGYSMMPLLRQKRDVIEIHPLAGRPKKYDVILYKRKNRYILHRVLKVLPDGYIIAGDHNTFLERDIKDNMILGVMTKVQRNGKIITPNNRWYKLYVHLWCDVYPVRMAIITVKRAVIMFLWSAKKRIMGRNKSES